MADNVELNSMSGGAVVAADVISAVAYQRVKLVEGADGTNDGDISSANPLPVELPATTVSTLTPPAAITGYATETTLGTVYDHVHSIDTKLVSGTDIGDVTINNSTGAAAVNIQDGGNTITVDGAVTNTVLSVVGTGTEAAAQRVTIATDSTGVISVDDNGASLTVDGSVTAVSATATNLKAEVTIAATQTLATVTTVGTVTTITNAVHVDDNSSTLTVDQGTATNLKTQAECYQGGTAVSTSAPLQVSVANTGANSTAVKVNVASAGIASGAIASGAIASGAVASGAIASGAIASGALAAGSIAVGAITAGDTSIATTEDTARAAGEHLVKIGISRLDTPAANANVGTDGDYTNITCDNFGKVWVAGSAIEDAAETAGMSVMVAGAIRRDTCASSSGTSGDVSTVNTDATGALWVNTQCSGVEDAGETAGGNLMMAGAVRRDTCASSSGTSGDNSTINTDAVGALWTDPQGNVAHDAADAGNPIKTGARVVLLPGAATALAANDRADNLCDSDSALFVREGCNLGECLYESISNTNGSSTACAVFTTGAGIRNVITDIVAYNSSATAGFVILTDGSAGTTMMTVPLPAGGGAVINLKTPIRTTANTALYYDVSGALTTVYLTFTGFRSKVA